MIMNIILLLMAGVAVFACETLDLMIAVLAVAVFGILSSLAFLLLGAHDLAVLQLVIEVVILSIVVAYTGRKYPKEKYIGRQSVFYMMTLVFIAIMLYASQSALNKLFEYSQVAGKPDLAKYFRSSDILAASSSLFAAIIGIMAVLRGSGGKDNK